MSELKPTRRPIREVLRSMGEAFYKANGYYPTEEDAIRLTDEARMEIELERKIDKLQKGDEVRFSCNGVHGLIGTIIGKDRQGGGVHYGVCPSVDVQGKDDVLYKHIAICDVVLLTDDDTEPNTADPFCSKANMTELENRIADLKSGKSILKEHELIEVD